MREKFKYLFICIICFFATMPLHAQTEDRPVWLSLQVGHNEYNGDYGSEFFKFKVGSDLALGFTTGLYLNPSFDLAFTLDFGVLDKEEQINDNTIESFSNSFISTKLLVRYKLYNGYLLRKNTGVQPYVKAGVGLSSYTGDGERIVNGVSAGPTPKGSTVTIPLAIGADIPVSEGTSIFVESMYHRTFAEGFDGRDQLDNADHDDYIIHSVGVKFALSKKSDRDGDGIADKNDNCPDLVGPENFEGCPDTDGDGFDDRSDFCPQVAGVDYLDGCPDTDGDRIEDSKDECPELQGPVDTGGCPDEDEDGVSDSLDKCPKVSGDPKTDGCPDADGDTVINSQDECPNEPGVAEFNGCPKAIDTDGDGIPNADDKCPDQAGVAERDGCPVAVTPEIREEVKNIARNIEFNSGQITFAAPSFDVLEQLLEIMKNDKNLNLIIDAYTDSEGRAAYNLQLSRDRANAVKAYLLENGINQSRLRAEGYGEILPVASNDTQEGRNKNRRIELSLTYF